MTEDELREQAEMIRGSNAENLLKNEMLTSALDQIEQAYTEQLLGSRHGENLKREQCYHMVHAVRDLRAVLRETVTTGKLAAKAKEMREAQERFRKDE